MTRGSNARKYVLPSLSDFQHKLEEFFQSTTKPKQEERERYSAYIALICQYYEKGMSLREIASSTGIGIQTVAYWIKKKGIRHTQTKQEEAQALAT
jgi:DNA invertase Pin-like site-specific DNA recombinase